MEPLSPQNDLFHHSSRLYPILIGILLTAGFLLRMVGLTQPPLDTHPTRQLHSAIMARGLYYQSQMNDQTGRRELAIEFGKKEPVIEPPILETLMAFLYQVTGGEKVWMAKILSSLFWILGGLALWALAKDITNRDGALLTLIIYLFLPEAVIASRTFQPDPLMVTLIIGGWWGFNRWRRSNSWKDAILTGVFSGLAILVKNVAIFFLLPPFAAVLLSRGIIGVLRSRKVWMIALLAILPGLLFTLYGTLVTGMMNQQFNLRFFPNLWIQPGNYLRWFSMIDGTVGVWAVIAAAGGFFILREKETRLYIVGMAAGYAIYGFTFDYHLPLIPMVALPIASIGKEILGRVNQKLPGQKPSTFPSILMVIILLTTIVPGYSRLNSINYKKEVNFWEGLGVTLQNSRVVGLTEDYGYRLVYFGWVGLTNWPATGDLYVRELAGKQPKSFEDRFEQYAKNKDYFLVTWMEEFNRQDELRNYLQANYPVIQGDNYLLFDLNQPLVHQ